jgi:hypothetical protein
VDVHLRASRGRAVFGSAVASTGPLPAWIPEVRVEVPGDPGGGHLESAHRLGDLVAGTYVVNTRGERDEEENERDQPED